MRARRAIAAIVLTALAGSLGLPWLGQAHQFNDDPHWAVVVTADRDAVPRLTSEAPGDHSHCEICHWLRTLRTADSVSPSSLVLEARVLVPPAPTNDRTRAASLRDDSARAPPALL